MKSLPTALLTFLQSGAQFQRADLFTITLANTQVIRATSWQLDVISSGQTYSAVANGAWSRGPVTSEATFDCSSNTMDLSVSIPAESTVNLPGTNVPLFQAVNTGLFDAAQVTVQTAYSPLTATAPLPSGFDTSLGLETTFFGEITNVDSCDRSQCTFAVADLLYRLNMNTPPNIIQSPCQNVLFDGNCTLNKSSFTVLAQVASGSNQLVLNTTATLPAIGNDPLPYTQGIVTFTSGQNVGMAYRVKIQNSTTQIMLDSAPILPITVGDQFTLTPGCDLLTSTCSLKFGNLINFRGYPNVPDPTVVAQ